MTRSLPWLKEQHHSSSDRDLEEPRLPAAPLSLKRARTPDVAKETQLPITKKSHSLRAVRTPSTSPPPEPPSEVFMEEGLDKDDKYRMVEDEFLDIAKLFTGHLHHQEYQRMKKAAKHRNESAIRSISRPVSGALPNRSSSKAKAATRDRKLNSVQDLLENDDDSDDVDNDETSLWRGTGLTGLMGAREPSKSLAKLGTVTSSTRASAGFKQKHASHNLASYEAPSTLIQRSTSSKPESKRMPLVEEDIITLEDDDLDAPVRRSQPTHESQDVTVEQHRVIVYPSSKTSDGAEHAKAATESKVSSTNDAALARYRAPRKPRTKEEDDTHFGVIPTFLR